MNGSRSGKRKRVSAVLLAWRAERLWGLLIAGKRLHPEGQPRELFADNPQLVLRAGVVEPVDQPDQRADMLLGQLKETLGGLGRHRTSSGRTAMLGHDQPSLRTETRYVTSAARFLFYAGAGTGCVNCFTLGLRGLREPGARVNASGV